MTNIAVSIPPDLKKYREGLRTFFEGMIRKLSINSHKDTPAKTDLEGIIKLMLDEVEELREQLSENRFDENSLAETYDCANYAFLAFVALRNDGVKTKKERLVDEFFDIDVESGKVYVKKTRSGSSRKVGDENTGTNRSGYVDIRLQNSRLDCSVATPRSHLVWWKATGKWPTGVIDHINGIKNDDRISNLRDVSFSDNSRNRIGQSRKYPPFVTRYLPSGRQHLNNYGKFVYQRRFKEITIRVGYYDTPEEAALKGPDDWQRRVNEDWVAKPVHSAKLTKLQVEMIRTSNRSIYSLAKQLKVAPQTVWAAKRGKSHKEV